MESSYGLLFVRRYASFDCSDPLTPRSQLAFGILCRPSFKMRREDSTSLGRSGLQESQSHRNSPDAAVSVLSITVWLKLAALRLLYGLPVGRSAGSWHADSLKRQLLLAAGLKCHCSTPCPHLHVTLRPCCPPR